MVYYYTVIDSPDFPEGDGEKEHHRCLCKFGIIKSREAMHYLIINQPATIKL